MTKKPYLGLARQYRPARFEDVLGQEAIATALKNAITSGKIAQAWLFAGPRGIGKTSMARILAKALNCQAAKGPTPSPCGDCEACQAIARGSDVDAMEFDAASNRKVEEIQTLILDHVDYPPARCRYRIYIIDEVQQLSDHAFDSLLKTLEEPPAHVRFIFATTHPGKVPATIHSRCQRFDFRRVAPDRLLGHLKTVCSREKVEVPEETLRLVARSAQGGVRDALSMLEQVIALGGASPAEAAALVGIPPEEAFASLLDAALAGDVLKGFAVVEETWNRGWDLKEFSEGFVACLRDHLVASAGDLEALAWRYGPESRKSIQARAQAHPTARWLDLLDRAVAASGGSRETASGRLGLELLFLSLLPSQGQAQPVRETPVASPRPSPVPAASALDWEAVLAKVGEKRMSLAAMLRGTRPSAPAGDGVLIRLPSDRSAFDVEKLSEPDKRALVEEALKAVSGRPLKVRYELEGARSVPVPAPETARPQAGAPPPNDPIVALATKLLAGRVVKRPPPG